MHDDTIRVMNDNHIQTEWILQVKGKPAGSAKFDLKQEKKK